MTIYPTHFSCARTDNKTRRGRVSRLAGPTAEIIERAIHVQRDRLANESLSRHEREQAIGQLSNLLALYRNTTGHDLGVLA